MTTLFGLVAFLVIGVLVAVEVAMAPTAQERVALYTTFGIAVIVTGVAGWVMLRYGRRAKALRISVLMPPVAAVTVAAAVVSGAALTMFLSPHDLRLVFIALVLGVGLGLVLAGALVRPLATDLNRLTETARRVARGDLTVTTGVERLDEIGEVAAAMDNMIGHLAEAERTREKNQRSRQAFLTAVGHDLRTPLSSLQATLEALQDGVASDPIRYMSSMSADLEFLNGLVDDLFMLTRIETGDVDLQPVPVALTELCEEVLEAMRPLASRRRVTLDLSSHLPFEVEIDPRAVARVLRNLVDNAIRHAPDGSTVTISIEGEAPFPLIAVDDQGPGFPEPSLPGSSSDGAWVEMPRPRDQARSGLGLTIARGLVEAHGGMIRVEEAAGGRVVFNLGRTSG